MSYDLYLRARSGDLDSAEVVRFLSARPNWRTSEGVYENPDTGVYFLLDPHSQPTTDDDDPAREYSIALNINYFRPSYFILEAEPEVTALVKHFDLVVLDPQIGGMGAGKYQKDLLIQGWSKGNEFDYSALLANDQGPTRLFTCPAQRLLEIWTWNFGRKRLQSEMGDDIFVPKIVFLEVGGAAVSSAVWPDAIPTVLPKVDYLIVPRKKHAPRYFFRRREDRALVRYEEVAAILVSTTYEHCPTRWCRTTG